MTKKHFRLIAQTIHLTVKDKPTRDRLVDVLCHGFTQFNANFNATRFREACEKGI